MTLLSLSLSAALLVSVPTAGWAKAPCSAVLPAQDATSRVQALIASYQAAEREFYARLQTMTDEAAQTKALQSENPLPAFIERFRELAFESAGSAAGVTAWVWVANLSIDYDRGAAAKEALEVLVNDHMDSSELGNVITNVRYGASVLGQESARATLRAILAGAPQAAVKAQAQFSLASLLMESSVDTDKAQGRALFEELVTKYADVEGGWSQRAKGMLFELQHLQIGMLAPDFKAVDQDGVAWNLYDYRGKVVVVDFWGFW